MSKPVKPWHKRDQRHGRSGPPRGPGSNRHERPDVSGRPAAGSGRITIYGLHAVAAAVANDARKIHRVLLTENAQMRLDMPPEVRGLGVERVAPRDLDRILGADTVHQGAMIETEALPEPALDALCEQVAPGRPLVVLDQVTDPHNVGAIMRSAAVFGATGLVMTRRHSPPLSDALAKAASGALELVAVTLVANLARALEEIAGHGVQRVGLDGEADCLLEDAPLDAPIALVLGAEGKGLRRLTRDTCDQLCRIGAPGGLASLNVSNAAAVALYAASHATQRRA